MNCALITGGSKGIGRATGLQLSRDHKLHILINYASDTVAAKDTLKTILSEGGSAELLKFNVQNKEEVDEALQNWQKNNHEKFISVLVNNAGINMDGYFMMMSENKWDDVIAVNLKGMFNVTHQVIRKMMINKKGRIINMASLSGMKGIAGQTNYAAAKAGLIGATKALAQEVATKNITVNAISPGFVNTNMIDPIHMEKYINLIPMGRVGEPEEIAHLVSFLASDKASYITGEVININGGIYS